MPGNRILTSALHYFPLILFALNFITKALYLTAEDIGLDEPFSIYHAQFPIPVLVEQLEGYNNPPLYEIILHFWIKAFGISPLSVRMLPMILACICPIALYFFARRNFSLTIAVTSSLLLSFNYLLLYYSHDCRVYTLFVLLTILSMHFYFETVDRSRRNLYRVSMFILSTSLLIYAHYFGFFVLMFQGVHLLLFFRRHLLLFAGFYIIVLILYIPHLLPFILRFGDSVSRGTWIEAPSGIEGLYNSLWVFSNFPFVTVGCIIILVAAFVKFIRRRLLPAIHSVTNYAFLTKSDRTTQSDFAFAQLTLTPKLQRRRTAKRGTRRRLRARRTFSYGEGVAEEATKECGSYVALYNFDRVFLVLFWFFFVHTGMYIISFWVPMYIHRYLIYGLPAYFITLGLCVEYLFSSYWDRGLVFSVLILCFVLTLDYNPDKKQPVSEAMTVIMESKNESTSVLVYPHDFMTTLAYHGYRGYFQRVEDNREYHLLDSLLRSESVFHLWSVDDLERYKPHLKEDLMYFAIGQHAPSDPVFKWLNESRRLAWTRKVGAYWYISYFEHMND